MVKIYLNNTILISSNSTKYCDVIAQISETTHLNSHEFYLEQNGKLLRGDANVDPSHKIHCILRLPGGKGGFGSMLRAIGAQIEKTTNREACRDLSGRRLRDINEEKRLKAWLEKQADREREAAERKKRKIEKLLAVPKHDFTDKEYEETRSKLTEKVNDAVEEGFKKSQDTPSTSAAKEPLKRKTQSNKPVPTKKKKLDLWIGSDVSDTDTSDDESVPTTTATRATAVN